MIVNILANPTSEHLRRVESVASLINGCQRHYRIEVVHEHALAKKGTPVVPQELAGALARPPKFIIGITEDPFDDNWFSHEYRDSAVITVSDWEAIYAPPSIRAYIIYQIAQALIHFSADMSEEIAMNCVHEPPVGGLYDFALEKPSMRVALAQRASTPRRKLNSGVDP